MKTETKHTPGPWEVVGTAIMKKIGPQNDSWMDIASISHMNFANARLIAAAPELLEACKAALSLIQDDGHQGGKTWTVGELESAIAKAEGNP